MNVFILDPGTHLGSLHWAESAEVTELELSDCLMLYRCQPCFKYLNMKNVDKNGKNMLL
jgi:hypothetical protein